MGYRAKRIAENMEETDNAEYWKHNLSVLAKCRTLRDVYDSPELDPMIKTFIQRDIFYRTGTYFAVIERCGPEDFIIGDTYPTLLTGEAFGNTYTIFSIFPISPSRVILLVSNGAKATPEFVTNLKKETLNMPVPSRDGKRLHFRIRKVYQDSVNSLNTLTFKEAKAGVAFADPERVFIEKYIEEAKRLDDQD